MDIQVASNFERLLYFILGGNPQKVREVMDHFRREGRYCFESFVAKGFSSSSASDSEIPGIISMVSREFGYLVDPHTACGFKDLPTDAKSLVLATAHPAKFPDVYEDAGLGKPTSPVLESLLGKDPVKYESGHDVSSIRSFIESHCRPSG